jgi:hypothetical protein
MQETEKLHDEARRSLALIKKLNCCTTLILLSCFQGKQGKSKQAYMRVPTQLDCPG